ncbi:MAG: hypothetical protein UV38_C0003G0157 [candidate division TM6 bacterium GW2011_GWE2_42_60]|nr:MAG: hypothetical protein UV38_C0003G0157 [candidate division TM6 bacterium GW2011_GWE2_42_60]HBY05366.1 hypothetical protein [Candidatus Dependentiae bacterium]
MKLVKLFILFGLVLSIQNTNCAETSKKQTSSSTTSITSNPLLTITTLTQGAFTTTQSPQKLINFNNALSSLIKKSDLHAWAQALFHGTAFSASTLAMASMILYVAFLTCKKDTRFSQLGTLIFSLAMLPSACFLDEENSIFGVLWASLFGGLIAYQYTQMLKHNKNLAQDDDSHLL